MVRLREEVCERLVVEVEDPGDAVGRINRAAGASAHAASTALPRPGAAPIAKWKGVTGVREVCYCGRIGEVEDREPVYGDALVEALRCPWCGHLDPLPQLDDDTRREVLKEAERRALERLVEGAPAGSGRFERLPRDPL